MRRRERHNSPGLFLILIYITGKRQKRHTYTCTLRKSGCFADHDHSLFEIYFVVKRGSSGTRQNSQTDSTIVRILRLKKIITGKIFHAKTWYYVGTEPLMLATLPLCTATLMACSRKLVTLLSLKLSAIRTIRTSREKIRDIFEGALLT